MTNCIIYSKNPPLYKSNLEENTVEFNLNALNKLIKGEKEIEFISSKTETVKNPKNDYVLIIEDDFNTIAKLIKYSFDSGEIANTIICTDASSTSTFIQSISKEPDLITLDFQLRNDDQFIEETTKLYQEIKLKWKDVPVVGITNFETKSNRKGITELIKLINGFSDSVYDKPFIWNALPTIFRDKIRITHLNRNIKAIKLESEKKEQIIENLEAKSNSDYAQLYFNRKIELKKIEEIKPTDIYRKYNLVSSNSFPVKCLLFKAITNSATDDPVIVAGQIGSGKDIVPKIIHDNSKRKYKPYEVYDCTKADGADTNVVITSLFGAVKGFIHGTDTQPGVLKRNNEGTVFLDELHHLPLDVQKMLLRVLQNKEITPLGGVPEKIDVRIIAGTNQDINRLVSEEKFHSDLYSRLCRDIINVPTLAQRGKDEIIIIAKSFLQKYCERNSITHKGFSMEAINKLSEYTYPNFNIRELEGVIANAAIYVSGNIINEDDIVFDLPEFSTSNPSPKDQRNETTNFASNDALKSFQMNKSKQWLSCIIRAIDQLGDKPDISSREIIKVFVSPSNGTYSRDASFSPAINDHIENFLSLLETSEFHDHKETVLKLNVVRWAYEKKLKNSKK
jgi:DNA-binding NtrC family response regulator